jgi:hypothetical protein
MAWDGASYKSAPKKYIHHLSQDELHDIDKALRHFQSNSSSNPRLTAIPS